MATPKKQWPQSVLAPWAWHPEPRGVERLRDKVSSGDGGILGSRAVVVSVILSVVFVSVGMVGLTTGAFSSAGDNAGNSFQAAASFCDSPGSANVTATEDSFVYELQPTTNFGSNTSLYVQSKPSENIRTLVKFALPSVPAGCSVTSATLSLFSTFATPGRTIQAFQAASSWTEAGVTWNNKPATTGTAATSASGTDTRSWSVTTQVQAMYSGSNNGFVLRDSVEGGPSAIQVYTVRTTSTPPRLAVTWGGNGSSCAAPGNQFVVANADTYVYQATPATNYGTDTSLYVFSSPNANIRTLVQFALPVTPAGCSVTSATLSLHATSSTSGRTIQAYRAASSWTETGVIWNNQPATAGTPATLASGTVGWQTWSVTTLVQEQYSIANNGFLLRDSVESGPNAFQQWTTRTNASTPPVLVVTFG